LADLRFRRTSANESVFGQFLSILVELAWYKIPLDIYTSLRKQVDLLQKMYKESTIRERRSFAVFKIDRLGIELPISSILAETFDEVARVSHDYQPEHPIFPMAF